MARTHNSTRTCDGCGCEGVVCDTVDGEILTQDSRLVIHPEVEQGATILVAGRSDGSDLHHTYCEDCAVRS